VAWRLAVTCTFGCGFGSWLWDRRSWLCFARRNCDVYRGICFVCLLLFWLFCFLAFRLPCFFPAFLATSENSTAIFRGQNVCESQANQHHTAKQQQANQPRCTRCFRSPRMHLSSPRAKQPHSFSSIQQAQASQPTTFASSCSTYPLIVRFVHRLSVWSFGL
jgi:hypothetical protein